MLCHLSADRNAPEDHPLLTRMFAAGLRQALALRGAGSRAAEYAELLLAGSEEFRKVWDDHEVGVRQPGSESHQKLQLLAVLGAEASAFAHGERPEETRPRMP